MDTPVAREKGNEVVNHALVLKCLVTLLSVSTSPSAVPGSNKGQGCRILDERGTAAKGTKHG